MIKMNSDNTVFYSSCDDTYAIFSITSLLTIRKQLPDAQLALIGKNFSLRTLKILKKYNITHIELDLSSSFYKSWGQYPEECYYYFAGPEYFYKKGYDYSVYIDGDVLCCDDPLKNIKFPPDFFSGIIAPSGPRIFGNKDWQVIKRKWGIKEKQEYERINAGIVYFNNKKMDEIKFLENISKLFDECIKNNIPRKGDDSLFALYQIVYRNPEDKDYLDKEYNYVLQFYPWKYPIKNIVFFHFSLDKPWKRKPYKHTDEQSVFNPYIKEWRRVLFCVSKKRWIKSYIGETIMEKYYTHSKKIKAGFRKEKQAFSGLRYHIWKRRNNIKKQPIRCYWFNGRKNFGDMITEDIVRELFGYRIIWCPKEYSNLVGAGSILTQGIGEKAYVWGSGIIEDGDSYRENLIFCAVRGKSTRSRIDKKWSNIPIGDPGLLANITYPVSGIKNNKIGIMPHYVDENHPVINKMRHDDRYIIMNVADSPQENAEKISQCKLVLSSSLHGLIFADSFGIPNVHIQLSDKVIGGEYKFKDYCSAINKKYKQANIDKIFDQKYLDELIADYQPIRNLKKIQRKLIKAFPYK